MVVLLGRVLNFVILVILWGRVLNFVILVILLGRVLNFKKYISEHVSTGFFLKKTYVGYIKYRI